MYNKKQYRVIKDYWDLWSIQSEEDAIIDYAEIKRLTKEWDKKISDLMSQCELL